MMLSPSEFYASSATRSLALDPMFMQNSCLIGAREYVVESGG